MMMDYSKHKIFSGALQFTVFISVVIALLLAALLLLNYTHRFFIQQSKSAIENIQLGNSGIKYLLTLNKTAQDTMLIESLSDENQKVEGHLSNWGIFEKAVVKSIHRKKISYKVALVGTIIEPSKRPALYLKENFKPLKIVGETILEGSIHLPSQGISAGYIAGQSFYGDKLVNGSIHKSNTTLPLLIKNYEECITKSTENIIFSENLPTNTKTTISNSFLKPTRKLYSKNTIILNQITLTGNICVESEKSIIITKSAILKDIIIKAPLIEVQDNSKGNFQIIAEEEIKIGKNCNFIYPSALVINPSKTNKNSIENQNKEIKISIDAGTQFKGSIVLFKPIQNDDFITNLTIDKQSLIVGEVFCEGNLELSGKVIGSVYTNQFITNTVGTIFINHINGGVITNKNLPESFCGVIFENEKKNIAKWLY